MNQDPYRIRYEVQERTGKGGSSYAVRRHGARGGVKTVGVYTDDVTAERVRRELNLARVHEIGA